MGESGSNQKDGKYLTASMYYLWGNVIGQGIVLLSSIIFTRIMSQDAYGLVSTYSAWVLVFNTFIGLNLFITVRNAYIDYKKDYHRFTSSILLFSIVAFLVLTSVVLSIIAVLKVNVDLFVVFLAALQAISLHTINLQMAVFAMENKYKARTILMVLPNVLHTVLSVILILIYSHNHYYAKIIGNVVGLLLFAFLIVIGEFKKEKPVVCKEYWKYAAAISVPGILHTLSDLILMQSDRIMLTSMRGADETAVYSLVYNIGSILIALYTAINGAWTPWFYKNLEEKHVVDIRKVQLIYIVVFSLLTVGLLTISPEMIKILSPKEYWVGIDYVNLIVIASFLIFIYAFFTTYLMYLKKTKKIARNTVIVAILNLLLNYVLIPYNGAIGASIATIISYLVLFILHCREARKYDREVFCEKEMLGAIGGLIVYGVIFYFIRDNWIIRYVIVVVLILLLSTIGLRFIKTKSLKKD